MNFTRMAICVLTLTLLAGNAQSELSVRLPLPKQLSAETLPPFTAKGQDGESMFQKRHLERMIAQDPKIARVALVYFATWCHPCAVGSLKLKAAKEALKRNNVLTIYVNVGETDVAAVRKWIKDFGDPGLPLIMDTKSQMVGPYGLTDPSGKVLMPRTIVLNRNLKPLFLLGTEGDDFPEIIWKHNPE